MPSFRAERSALRSTGLTQAPNAFNHFAVTRTILSALRCALAAMLAITVVAARPSMMTSHAMAGMPHGCSMSMASHQRTGTDHDCSNTTRDECCDDCLCAGPIGFGAREPVVVIIATYVHIATVIEPPTEVVRSHHQPALRLPPPLGPPLIARS